LSSQTPQEWPVLTVGWRARYLLLALAMSGQMKSAVNLIPKLEVDLQGKDHVKPDFAHFKNWFLTKFG
jgi:hypothetical protein